MDPASRSLICCVVIPSGPPDEPRVNVRNAFMTSFSETAMPESVVCLCDHKESVDYEPVRGALIKVYLEYPG